MTTPHECGGLPCLICATHGHPTSAADGRMWPDFVLRPPDVVALRSFIDRLTRERDEALAVAADKREGLGLTPGLVEWLLRHCSPPEAAQCYELARATLDPEKKLHAHGSRCQHAEWARRIGGLEETQRQVDASHEAAMVEDRRRAGSDGYPSERTNMETHAASLSGDEDEFACGEPVSSVAHVFWPGSPTIEPTCQDCRQALVDEANTQSVISAGR